MAFDMLNHLIGLINLEKSRPIRNPGRAAKLPPAADFAGPFTSP
jgi:hypothetical protein